MLVTIPDVLTEEQLRDCRARLAEAEWEDGRKTAGAVAAAVKNNLQVPAGSPAGQALAELVLVALAGNPTFVSAALPLHILPPLFNRYGVGQTYGVHVDGAIRSMPDGTRIRTDLSATLFLSAPDDYEGGELTVETLYGAQSVKLPAGHLVLYPATSLHCVTPVTSGERVACFFWVQSMVRDETHRTLLFDLDQTIQDIRASEATGEAAVRLSGIYHNLIRQWAET